MPESSNRSAPDHANVLDPKELAEGLERLIAELRKAIHNGTVPTAPSLIILERLELLTTKVRTGIEQNGEL